MSSLKIEIRPISNNDSIDELTLMLHRAYKKLSDQDMYALASHQDTTITRKRISESKCFVAVRDDKLIGTIAYHAPDRSNKHPYYNQPWVASFGQFGVDPDYQNTGIGCRLIDVAEACAIEDGAAEIALDTPETASQLISFYNKRGYAFHMHAKWQEVNYRSVILRKVLNANQ